MITNKTIGVAALWHFLAGRGAHEKTLAELNQQLAFDAIPTQNQLANSVWLQISALTHNLVRSFQLAVGAPRRKRTYAYVFESLQTLRFTLIQQPARIVRPAGRPELLFSVSQAARVASSRSTAASHSPPDAIVRRHPGHCHRDATIYSRFGVRYRHFYRCPGGAPSS